MAGNASAGGDSTPPARALTWLEAGDLTDAPVQEFFTHFIEGAIGADGSGIEPYQPIADALHNPQ